MALEASGQGLALEGAGESHHRSGRGARKGSVARFLEAMAAT